MLFSADSWEKAKKFLSCDERKIIEEDLDLKCHLDEWAEVLDVKRDKGKVTIEYIVHIHKRDSVKIQKKEYIFS